MGSDYDQFGLHFEGTTVHALWESMSENLRKFLKAGANTGGKGTSEWEGGECGKR